MKKFFLAIVFILPLSTFSRGIFQKQGLYQPQGILQKHSTVKFDPERLTYGGNLWLQFGTYTYIDISPAIGYRITDNFVAGLGVGYTYLQQRYSNNFVYKSSLYGIRPFVRYDILEHIFLYSEYEFLNWDYYDFLANENTRKWSGTPLIGGGYMQGGGGDGLAFMAYALYAFNSEKPESPYYQRPLVFRVGFMFG